MKRWLARTLRRWLGRDRSPESVARLRWPVLTPRGPDEALETGKGKADDADSESPERSKEELTSMRRRMPA